VLQPLLYGIALFVLLFPFLLLSFKSTTRKNDISLAIEERKKRKKEKYKA